MRLSGATVCRPVSSPRQTSVSDTTRRASVIGASKGHRPISTRRRLPSRTLADLQTLRCWAVRIQGAARCLSPMPAMAFSLMTLQSVPAARPLH